MGLDELIVGPFVIDGAIEEIVGREVMFPFLNVGALEMIVGRAVAFPLDVADGACDVAVG